MNSVPPALAAAFAEKVTVSAPELCRLLPLDPNTLREHIRRGHIDYVQTGFGMRAPRRAFTLEAVLRFLQNRSRTECPPTGRPTPRRATAVYGGAANGFLELRAPGEAKGFQARREQPTGKGPSAASGAGIGLLARIERVRAESKMQRRPPDGQKPTPQLCPVPVTYSPPPAGPAKPAGGGRRSVVRQADQPLATPQRAAVQHKPQPGDANFEVWRKAQAVERRKLVAQRMAAEVS